MTDLAWPLVALVLGGGALITWRQFLEGVRSDVVGNVDEAVRSLVERVDGLEGRRDVFQKALEAHNRDIAELKKYRETETVQKLRGGR